MRLSEYCTSQDVDRAIAVTVDSFVGAQKVSCRKALGRAFAKYVILPPFPFPFPCVELVGILPWTKLPPFERKNQLLFLVFNKIRRKGPSYRTHANHHR